MEEINTQENIEKDKKQGKKIIKKWWFWTVISIVIIILLIGTILFFINKIPSKYYGTYTRYFYFDGNEFKTTYKISPLKIKAIVETSIDGESKIEEKDIEYSKKGKDLIIEENEYKSYLIIEDECLYIETNKDISKSKEYGLFYWNVKSDKADIYKIENKSEEIEDLIEKTMSTWTRELIYDINNQEMGNSNFYIIKSDKEADKTDLNTYEINYSAAGGDLTLYYNRRTGELKRVYYSGSILETVYSGINSDSMDLEDVYDSKAMLLSFMYVLGNKDNIELNRDEEDTNNYTGILKDLSYRTDVAKEYDELFNNGKVDEKFKDRYIYSLNNDKYDIQYTTWISSSSYSTSGMVSFNINLI